MAKISQTGQAMRIMQQLPTVEARLEYQRTLPKGIGARVLNKILDNARAARYTEYLERTAAEALAKLAEAESWPYDAWSR